jgi:hypothetical protein
MSSSYHPQSDGQTERVNQTMETFLRCFVNACPSKWLNWLPLAEFWYNSCDHSAIGRSPFEALYGYTPRHFGISSTDAVPSSDLSSWLREREVMNSLIKQHLARAKLRMKKQADKSRAERSFEVGECIPQAAALCSVIFGTQIQSKTGFQILWAIQDHCQSGISSLQVGLTSFFFHSPGLSCLSA